MAATTTSRAPAPLQTAVAGPSEPGLSHGSSESSSLSSTPLTDGSDSEDQGLYGDGDDAQSMIQPAMGPAAARLAAQRTPAAEKAAALERLPGGGLFDGFVSDTEYESQGLVHEAGPSQRQAMRTPAPAASSPRLSEKSSSKDGRDMSLGPMPSPQPYKSDLPSPWRAEGKPFVVEEPHTSLRPSMAGVFKNQTRSQRASSLGESALKRLSKALDSISIPSNLLPNIPTPSFRSPTFPRRDSQLSLQHKSPTSSEPHRPHAQAPMSQSRSRNEVAPHGDLLLPGLEDPSTRHLSPVSPARSHRLRRTASDASMLYHSLSRVSSFGDDTRFVNVREQINSRFKAIKDSWDAPTFKIPQLSQFPNILPAPLRKPMTAAPEESQGRPRAASAQALMRDDISPIDAVLENLTGDIVVLGGYRGSVLRSAHGPPHRRLWAPVKVGLNIRQPDLEVGLDPEDEETMESRIFPDGMLQNIGPVDISRRLFKKLRDSKNARNGTLRVHDYGYDWRLSPHLLSRKLNTFLATLKCNQSGTRPQDRGALVIAHSLGGMITRHAVNQRPELYSGVIYAGVPQRCINILGPIRNGDAVMLNEKVLTAQVNFSLRTSFVFLPEDGYCFINKVTREEYRIDLYNPEDWIKYRLSPCIGEPPVAMSRPGPLSGLLSLPDLSRRSWGTSSSKLNQSSQTSKERESRSILEAPRRAATELIKDRTLAPQMNSASVGQPQPHAGPFEGRLVPGQERHYEYLKRTLAETKKFRAEWAHRPELQTANAYPPLAVIYAKDIPTTAGAKVSSPEAIPSTEAYDELFFGSGDGVVLAKEAQLPPGYELVRGGRVRTDRGHITILGDLQAVGKALEAVTRGRRKGVGHGTGTETAVSEVKATPEAATMGVTNTLKPDAKVALRGGKARRFMRLWGM